MLQNYNFVRSLCCVGWTCGISVAGLNNRSGAVLQVFKIGSDMGGFVFWKRSNFSDIVIQGWWLPWRGRRCADMDILYKQQRYKSIAINL